ncbi:MAG: PLP-dependent aminotransferase family protein [Verrucomicrobiota bacterium]
MTKKFPPGKQSIAHLSELAQRIEAPPISWLMDQKLKYPDLISLAAGFTDGPSLPVEEVQKIFKTITRTKKRSMEILQYGVGAGRDLLRDLTASNTAKLDEQDANNPAYHTDRILITHGSQQFLYLLSEALFEKNDIVILEAPTYFVYLGMLQSFGVQSRSIPMKSDGMDIEHLKATLESLKKSGRLSSVKLLYLVSYFQNPTGYSTSYAKKKAILKLVRSYEKHAGHPIYILEDAAYRELKFPATPEQPSMLSLPHARDRVIYSSTYSKPFATGIRVGYGFVPEPLRTILLRIKGNHDFGTANLLQAVVEEALRSGLYSGHVHQLQAEYAKKSEWMCQSIRKYFSSQVRWNHPSGGLYVWAQAPDHVSTGPDSRLFKACLKERVMYVPGSYTYGEDLTPNKPDQSMRISYGSASRSEIQKGIKRLGAALHAAE